MQYGNADMRQCGLPRRFVVLPIMIIAAALLLYATLQPLSSEGKTATEGLLTRLHHSEEAPTQQADETMDALLKEDLLKLLHEHGVNGETTLEIRDGATSVQLIVTTESATI